MKKKSRYIAVCSLLAAISLAVLYIASIAPTGRLGIVALASLFGISAVIETNLKGCLAVYIVTAVLGFLVLPDKSALLLYVLFFGYYPILKSLAERQKKRVFEWVIKIIAANAALTLILLLFSKIIYDFIGLNWGRIIIYLVFNICFVLFDIGVSKAIGFYLARISKKIK